MSAGQVTAVPILTEQEVVAASLLADIREQIIGLLFNRHVFRTHQEIVRANPRLQGRPRSIFSEWAQVNYAVTNAIGVRRLASGTYASSDVNLVRLLDMLIREPGRLWDALQRHYPEDCARAFAELSKQTGELPPDWQISACKRLLGEDHRAILNAPILPSQSLIVLL